MQKKSADSTSSVQIARTLDRGLLLLETLAAAQNEPGVTELGELCGLDKSTVHRLLATLARRGYVQQNPRSRCYTLGLRIFELYDALQGKLGLQDTCRPFLARLVELTGETSHLAVMSGMNVIFIDWFMSSQLVSVRTQIGRQEPVHCTALGQAMLAFLPRDEVVSMLRGTPLHSYTTGTPTDIDALLKVIDTTRTNGYAFDDEEFIAGVRCVASPVLDFKGHSVAAIGISGPVSRLSREHCHELGRIVVEQAGAASRALGYRA